MSVHRETSSLVDVVRHYPLATMWLLATLSLFLFLLLVAVVS